MDDFEDSFGYDDSEEYRFFNEFKKECRDEEFREVVG